MTFIIAEAGINHNGELVLARELVHAAKDCGADAVKFQHFSSLRLWGDERIRKYELSDQEMCHLSDYCSELGIEFMCTPFGVPEVEFLTPLVKRWKIASGCLAKTDLLDSVASTGLPVILSTGMSDIPSVIQALSHLNKDSTTLLHCTSAYPCPIDEVNLNALDTLRRVFDIPVGYSDHTLGITVALAAVAKGAVVLEKHLTLDRTMEGPDHGASIEPKEFKIMVSAIRTVGDALGDGIKRPQPSEAETRAAWYG